MDANMILEDAKVTYGSLAQPSRFGDLNEDFRRLKGENTSRIKGA
jgi:hypothetical protein